MTIKYNKLLFTNQHKHQHKPNFSETNVSTQAQVYNNWAYRAFSECKARNPKQSAVLEYMFCNTLVLIIAFDTCISWAQASSKHSWAWAYGISSYSDILSHVMLIIYMHMLVTMCDQCKRWLWGHKNTLDTSRMVNGTMFVFMTWANFASKCWFTLKCLLHDASLTKVEQ